eukprot:8160660-Pyramimonas_sp.AAC.1
MAERLAQGIATVSCARTFANCVCTCGVRSVTFPAAVTGASEEEIRREVAAERARYACKAR